MKFENDVVVITGAARGLGRAHALLLAELGARVVVNDVGGSPEGEPDDVSAADACVREITAAGGTALADTHDGSTEEGATEMIESALNAFGRVDAVIANAGILRDKAFHHLSDADFFAVLNVHLVGTMRVFRAAYPVMREQNYGRLVATTSGAGLFGNYGQAAYSAAKLGIVGLTRTIAIEGASRDIKANVIAPAAATRLTRELLGPLADALEPEKVSPLAAYLCHQSLAHSGQIFSAGGGRFARVGIGVGQGAFSAEPDVDFIDGVMDEIIAEEGLAFPDTAMAETQLMLAALN